MIWKAILVEVNKETGNWKIWSMIEITPEWNNPPAFTCWSWTIEILKKGVKCVQEMCSRVSIYNFEQVFVYWDIFLNINYEQ